MIKMETKHYHDLGHRMRRVQLGNGLLLVLRGRRQLGSTWPEKGIPLREYEIVTDKYPDDPIVSHYSRGAKLWPNRSTDNLKYLFGCIRYDIGTILAKRFAGVD
jgi:hypothetical protein